MTTMMKNNNLSPSSWEMLPPAAALADDTTFGSDEIPSSVLVGYAGEEDRRQDPWLEQDNQGEDPYFEWQRQVSNQQQQQLLYGDRGARETPEYRFRKDLSESTAATSAALSSLTKVTGFSRDEDLLEYMLVSTFSDTVAPRAFDFSVESAGSSMEDFPENSSSDSTSASESQSLEQQYQRIMKKLIRSMERTEATRSMIKRQRLPPPSYPSNPTDWKYKFDELEVSRRTLLRTLTQGVGGGKKTSK